MPKFLFFLALSVFSTGFLSAQDSTIARLQAINRDIWAPFAEAYANGNAEQYIALHSKDFIRGSGGMQARVSSLNEYAAQTRAGFKRNKEKGIKAQIHFAFLERIAGATFASERGIYHYYSDDGKKGSVNVYGKFHVVERLENGRWKILFDYDSDEGGTIDKNDFDAAFPHDNWAVLKASQQTSPLKQVTAQIEAANAVYGERFKTQDTIWYAGRYTHDACILPEKTARICGLKDIISYYYNKGENRGLDIKITTLDVTGGPEAVIEEGIYTLSDDKGTVLDKGKFIATWVPEDGTWKLRREIWTTDRSD